MRLALQSASACFVADRRAPHVLRNDPILSYYTSGRRAWRAASVSASNSAAWVASGSSGSSERTAKQMPSSRARHIEPRVVLPLIPTKHALADETGGVKCQAQHVGNGLNPTR